MTASPPAPTPPTSSVPPPEASVWSAAVALLQLQAQLPPVTPWPRTAPLPVTFAQERLWTLVQLDPQSPVYNVPLAWRLNGPLDVAALDRALSFLCERHESLRMTFAIHEHRPCARVAPDSTLAFRVVDLRSLPAAARENELQRQAVQEARGAFDLSTGSLFRAALFQLDAADHLLVLTIHQIIFDGWSLRVLSRELGDAYRAAKAGRAPALPRLPVQYVDFAHWQRHQLPGAALETQLGFWRRLLAEPCRPLALPRDRPEARADTGAAGRVPFHLPRPQLDLLQRLGRAEGATTFMLLHAAWTALLHRLSGADDILIFASFASRTQPELQGVIGLLANVLPLRTRVPAGASFRELLRAAGAVVASGLAHQAVPFEKIVESLHTAGGVGESLFQVLMIYQNAPAAPPGADGLEFQPAEAVDHGAAKFDLLLDVANGPDGVRGCLKFRADRFDRGTIEDLLADWRTLLEEAIAAPDQPLAQLPLARLAARETKAAGVPAKLASPEASTRVYRDGLEMQLAGIWQKVLGVTRVRADDNFFDLGGHSMRAVQLFTELEQQMGLRLPIATLFGAPTFGQLARVLHEEGCETRWPAVVPIQPHGTRPPFLWLHTLGGGGGGGLLRYRTLANLLGPDQPSFGIEAPHEPFTNIEDMATAYLEMLKTLQPQGPYFLGGYCFAANVAFEMACQLEARGEKVAMLALLEAMPPEVMHRRTPITARNFGAFLRNLGYWTFDFFNRPPGEIRAGVLHIARRVAFKLGKYWGRWREPRPDFLELGEVVDIDQYPAGFRHYAEVHYQALGKYRPRAYLGQVTLFRARTRPVFTFDPLLGWGAHVKGGLTVKVVPGRHEAFLEEPLVRALANEFRESLIAAQAG